MKNKEKYFDRIIELMAQDIGVSKKSNTIELCETLSCADCIFNYEIPCVSARKAWLEAEYKEHEIDWSKVPVDTPILVWDGRDGDKKKRYFATYTGKTIYAWDSGRTSYTAWNRSDVVNWQHAEIAPGVDCTRWYKR